MTRYFEVERVIRFWYLHANEHPEDNINSTPEKVKCSIKECDRLMQDVLVNAVKSTTSVEVFLL